MNSKPIRLTLPLLTLFTALAAGCDAPNAGSNASRSTFDASQRLSVSQLNAAAQRLVTNIVANRNFARFKEANGVGSGHRVFVVMDTTPDNRTGDADVSYQEQLFDGLEQHFAENGVAFRIDRVNLSGPDIDERKMRKLKEQDSDDGIKQSTGPTLTGETNKASLMMQLTVFAQDRLGKREWELRAKLYEIGGQTLLVSANSQPKAESK